jgi:hypothetical protein
MGAAVFMQGSCFHAGQLIACNAAVVLQDFGPSVETAAGNGGQYS